MSKRQKLELENVKKQVDLLKKDFIKIAPHITDIISFIGLYGMNLRYWANPGEALMGTSLAWLMFKSGSEIGVGAAVAYSAIAEFTKQISLIRFEWPKLELPVFITPYSQQPVPPEVPLE